MALLENLRVGRKKFSFHLKKKIFLLSAHWHRGKREKNDCNLNMKELFTIISTILHIYLNYVSVENHQLLQNRKNYMTQETKNLIKNISRYEKYCVLVSSHPPLLCTYIQHWKEKTWTNWKKLLLSLVTASFNGTQTLAWYLCKFQSDLQTTQ